MLGFGALETGLTLGALLALALAIPAWVSVARNGELTGAEKAMWVGAIALFPIFGAVVYFSVRSDW
jgi:Phospholipase_D-nuclease N-terminal